MRVQRRVDRSSREETGVSAGPIITETGTRFSRVPLSFDVCDGMLWPLCLFIHHTHITGGIVVPERMNKQCGPQNLSTIESIVLSKNMIPLVIIFYPYLLKFHATVRKCAIYLGYRTCTKYQVAMKRRHCCNTVCQNRKNEHS